MSSANPRRVTACILGAGPHGLAMALAALAADPGLADDLVVVDPSGRWLATWETQLARLEIDVLRSPGVHHPCPRVDGLSEFIARRDLMTSGLPYDPPTSAAFTAFAHHLVDAANLAAPLAVQTRAVVPHGGGLRVETSGVTIDAERVIIAANPHRRVVPDWVAPLLGQTAVELAHAADVDLGALPSLDGERVVVIGGGLSAAHLACGAAVRGADVRMIARRPLQIRNFDTDPGWLGPKYLRVFDSTPDPRDRLAQARAARNGGSIPPWMHERLERHGTEGRIRVHEGAKIGRARQADDGCRLHLDRGEVVAADRIWLATGTIPDVAALRCLEPIAPDIATVDGYPVTDDDLRIGLHPVHVMGRLATLTLGPAAGNLWGARHAAHRITRAVTGVDIDFLASGRPVDDERTTTS